jgi:glycogen synthase
MIVRCMNMNFSWDKSATKYVNVFREALAAPPHINPLPFI